MVPYFALFIEHLCEEQAVQPTLQQYLFIELEGCTFKKHLKKQLNTAIPAAKVKEHFQKEHYTT